MPRTRCVEIIHNNMFEDLTRPACVHLAQYPWPRKVVADVSSFFGLVDIVCDIYSINLNLLSVFKGSSSNTIPRQLSFAAHELRLGVHHA